LEAFQEIVARSPTGPLIADAIMVGSLLETTPSVMVVKADKTYNRRCIGRAVQTKGLLF